MGIKGTRFGVKYQNLLVTSHLLNHEQMFTGTPIYIRYVVISFVFFTYVISVELFYLTQLCSFLGFLFEYLPIFIPYRFALYP